MLLHPSNKMNLATVATTFKIMYSFFPAKIYSAYQQNKVEIQPSVRMKTVLKLRVRITARGARVVRRFSRQCFHSLHFRSFWVYIRDWHGYGYPWVSADIHSKRGYGWIWIMPRTSRMDTDGWHWSLTGYGWIWLGLICGLGWIGLDGFRFIVNSDKGQWFGDVSHVYCRREFPPPVKYVH